MWMIAEWSLWGHRTRVAAEEEPTFPFYTSRLGIRAKDILEFYVDRIEGYENKFQLKMLHIFLNKGIKDDVYYWSELNKIINLYCQLKKICPELDSINIGGGFPEGRSCRLPSESLRYQAVL